MIEPTLGDYLKSINETKTNILRKEPEAERNYPSFVITRTLSYHIDCILFVNELNKLGQIPNLQHYEFLLSSIRQKKRFAKWARRDEDEAVVSALQKLNGYSDRRAREAARLLTAEEKSYILKITHNGD